MVTELLVVWVVGVVAFFSLWAILLKVIKRISERKEKQGTALRQAQGPAKDEVLETTEINAQYKS